VDGQDGVPRIVLVREEGFELGLIQDRGERSDLTLDIFLHRLTLPGQFEQDIEFLSLLKYTGGEVQVCLETFFPLLQGLRLLLVFPDVLV
jgi:hypothetical protein